MYGKIYEQPTTNENKFYFIEMHGGVDVGVDKKISYAVLAGVVLFLLEIDYGSCHSKYISNYGGK